MATISEINQVANYGGNPNLGGGNLGVLQFDLQPWQRLADFTYLREKEKNAEQKIQFKNAVDTASKDLAVDWSKILPNHRDEIMKEREDFKKFARDHPDSWSQNSKYFGELQEKKNKFIEKLNGAIGRGLEFEIGKEQARKAALSGGDMSKYMSSLEARVGGIFDKIDLFAEFEVTPPNLTAVLQGVTRDVATPNFIETTSWAVPDFRQIDILADDLLLKQGQLAPGMDERNRYSAMAAQLNEAIQGMAADNRMVNLDSNGSPIGFTQLAKSNGSIGAMINDIEAFNADVRKFNQIDPNNQRGLINPFDGLDENEIRRMLVYKNTVAKNKSVDDKKTLKETGLAQQLEIARMNDKTRRDIAEWDNAAQVEAASKKGDRTAQQLTTDAQTFADRIYNLVGNSSIKVGTRTVKAIPVEQLSPEEQLVLGISGRDNTGGITTPFGNENLYVYMGPKGGLALAEYNKEQDQFTTKTSYSKDALKSARITFALKQGAGKEYGAYGELNPNGLPPPATSSSESTTTIISGTTSSGLPIFTP